MDKVTDGVTFSSNLAVLFDSEDDEPDAEDDSLIVTINKNKLICIKSWIVKKN